MARYLGTVDGKTNALTQRLPVANGVTVTDGDFVYWSSGRITSATISGALLVGVCVETATGNSGGTVYSLVIVEPFAKYLVDNDNLVTTFAVTHVGSYFDLIGATGAQLVDTSSTSASTGQLYCMGYSPNIDPVRGDTSWGIFVIAEHVFANPKQ